MACSTVLVVSPLLASEPESTLAVELERAHRWMAEDPPRWTVARLAFERAAAMGSGEAKSYLGWIYEHGHGVAADPQRARGWYQQLAEEGQHPFAVKLAWMFLGAGDQPQAEQWFQRAIAAGYLPANIALGSVIVADALGGKAPQRVPQARTLLEAALAGGERMAALFLARIHVEGIGGYPTDAELGARYTRIAAEDGHAQMQGWMALMYLRGDGVAQDRMESAFWAALAAAGDDPLGRQLHEALQSELSPEEREAVLRRTLLWALERAESGQN